MKMLNKKLLSVVMVMLMLMGGLSIITTGAEAGTGGLSITAIHGAIRINGDDEFTTTASSEGWSGSGTPADPYIIENYEIDAEGGGNAIYIGNTTVNFIIRNCTLFNASYVSDPYYDGSGISLHNALNGLIYNNTIFSVKHGFYMYEEPSANTIRNNTIYNTMFGIYMEQNSDSNNITGNEISGITISGIYVSLSTGNRIEGNNISNSGLYGIYIHNAKQNAFTGNNLSGNKGGMWLELHSDRNIIRNNTIDASRSNDGLTLEDSIENQVVGNVISGTDGRGVVLSGSNNNVLSENTVSGSSNNGLYFYSSVNNTITNNSINMNQNGIDIESSDNNTLASNNISSNTAYGIQIISSGLNHIFNNTISNNNRQGIWMGSANQNFIENNTMSNNGISYGESAIYMDTCKSNTLKGNALDNSVEIWSTNSILDWNTHNIDATNTINGKPIYYFNNQTGISVPSDAGEVILANCTDSAVNGVSISNLTVGIEIGFCSGVDIKNSTFTNLLDKAIFVYDGQNMSFVNNSFLDSHYGIYLYGSDAAFVSENHANNTNTPVYIPFSSNYVDIENNTLTHSSDAAIYAKSVYGITIANNSISNSSDSAMYLLPSENGTIAYNRLSNNQNGIYLRYSTSTGNRMFNNIIESNSNFGIFLSSAQNNMLYNNTISGNGNYGLEIYGNTTGNRIYHNNFINNTHQAYDDGSNIWNSSYPDGGNYWSDYSGNDIFKGANQDQQGQDGIGDSPYDAIDAGVEQDHYPLMKPWNGTTASDTEAPHIIGSNPINNSANVSVSQQIIISFSEFMNQSSILYLCNPDPGGWTPSWSPITPTLTLYHSDFAYNTTYTFNITGGTDLSGKSLTNIPYGVVFTTEKDTIAPYVTITTPNDGAFFGTTYADVQWTGGDNQTWIDHYEIRRDNGSWTDTGNSTTETFTGLSDGNHTVEVRAYDSEGNWNNDTVYFTVDTTEPSLEITVPSNNSYLNISDVTVYWAGNDTNLDHYEVRLDNGSWVSAGSADNHTFYGLLEGNHSVDVRAYDMAGNVNLTTVQFYVDLTKPKVVLLSPQSGAEFNTSSVTVTWSGWDNSSSGVIDYRVDVDGVWIDVGLNNSYTAVNLSSSSHYFAVMAIDRAGLWNTSSGATIIVDTMAPRLWISTPLQDNSSAFNSTYITASWGGEDLPSDAPNSGLDHYEISSDSSAWVDVGMNTSFNLTGLSEGVHTFSLRVYDNAGNMNISTAEFWIDVTPPEFNITHPEMDSYLNTSYVNFTWNGGDNQSGINHYSFRIVGVSSWVNAGNGNYFQYPGYFNNGWHTVEIMGIDRGGNTLIRNVTFLVDTLRPTITVNNPTENGFWNSTEVEINWTATDDVSSFESSGLNHYEVSINGEQAVNVGLNTSYLITGLTDGSYELTVTAFDNAGNHANSTTGITVDRTPPTVTITEPEDGLTIGNDYVDLRVNWTGDDTGAGIDHYEIRVDNGTWVNKGSLNSSYVISADLGLNSVSGLHTFSVRAFDQAGNSAMDSVTFILDLDPPEVLNYSPQGENVSADSLISITFSEPINRSSFSISVGGSHSVTGNVSWSGNTATFTPDKELKDDVHVYVTASDVLDNLMSFNWSFSIAEAVEPLTGTVTGTILDESGSPVYGADIIYNGTVIGQTDENGTYSVELPPGTHNLTVSVNGESETISVNSSAGETTDAGESHTTLPSAAGNEDTGTGGASSLILYVVVLLVVLGIAAALFMRRKGAKPGAAEESTSPGNAKADGLGETAGETEEPPVLDN